MEPAALARAHEARPAKVVGTHRPAEQTPVEIDDGLVGDDPLVRQSGAHALRKRPQVHLIDECLRRAYGIHQGVMDGVDLSDDGVLQKYLAPRLEYGVAIDQCSEKEVAFVRQTLP